ncbi:MAG: hypothetical protein K2H47_07310 [Muribaculaceae bacterium]|nr:hypothetical protein [Muribaculaceae bacterium]
MKKSTILAVGSMLLLPGMMSATDFNMSKSQFKTAAPKREALNSATTAETRTVTDLIWQAPEGKNLKLDRSGITFPLSGAPFWYDNSPANMVICDNGDVYLQAVFFSYAESTYIVGHQEGNKITFDLPQTVVDVDYGGGYTLTLNATLGQFDEASSNFVAVNSELAAEAGLPEVENKIVMTVDENGVYTYDSGLKIEDGVLTVNNGDLTLCMCYADNGYWAGPAEVNMTMKPFEGKLVTPPAALETEPMGMTYNGTGHIIEVGFAGDEVYFKGVVADYPDSWIKGTVNGEVVNIPSTQYLGENFRYACFAYYASAYFDKETGLMTYLDSADFSYDAETKTFKAPENVVGLFNGAYDYVHFIEEYENMMIRPQVADPAITLNAPFDINYNDEGYYPFVEFSYSTLNKEGYMLNPENLYYVMYVDGEEYTFYADEYNTPEDMTYVPVLYNDYFNFISENGKVQVFLSFEAPETLGFKLCYAEVSEDGKLNVISESEMGMYVTTSVDSVIDDMKSAAEPVYYDIMGRRVTHPAKGDLLIERCGNNARKIIF